ncbi:MAG: hypothetical protein WBV94_09670 [Blastocatellia bacterium]
MTEHRGAERGLYDRLQREEFTKAREFLEGKLDDAAFTYEEICRACKSSMLFDDVKDITPQDLTRYRQRRARAEQRAQVVALLEADATAILDGAAKNPTGLLSKFVRKQLTEHIATRLDVELGDLGVVDVSREAARHALVEQRDRKLDLDEEKLGLEAKRIALQERQLELQNDRFTIASDTWMFILQWLMNEEPDLAEALTRKSDELLVNLEEHVAANA